MANFFELNYKDYPVRVFIVDNELMYRARDIIKIFGFKSAKSIINEYCENKVFFSKEEAEELFGFEGSLYVIPKKDIIELKNKVDKDEQKDVEKFLSWLRKEIENIQKDSKLFNNEEPMDTEIKIFSNDSFGNIRIIIKDDGPWFVVKDVCTILNIGRTNDAISGLDDDEKGAENIRTLGGIQKMSIVSESGFYALVIKSRKPEAKKFRKWVTSEVLPSIRETGEYSTQKKLSHSKSWDEVQSKEIDHNRLEVEFDSAMKEADMLAKYANEIKKGDFKSAKIIEDMYERKFGKSPIKLLSYPARKLLYSNYITVSEIGETVIPNISATTINKVLVNAGFQKKNKETGKWEAIGLGRDFSADITYIDDEGNEHINLRWHNSIIPVVKELVIK